jgi:hypothetical protein
MHALLRGQNISPRWTGNDAVNFLWENLNYLHAMATSIRLEGLASCDRDVPAMQTRSNISTAHCRMSTGADNHPDDAISPAAPSHKLPGNDGNETVPSDPNITHSSSQPGNHGDTLTYQQLTPAVPRTPIRASSSQRGFGSS